MATLPFSSQGRAGKINYLVPRPEQAYREEALSGGRSDATHRSPAFEGVYWVCKPYLTSMHSNPRAQFSFGYSPKSEL